MLTPKKGITINAPINDTGIPTQTQKAIAGLKSGPMRPIRQCFHKSQHLSDRMSGSYLADNRASNHGAIGGPGNGFGLFGLFC